MFRPVGGPVMQMPIPAGGGGGFHPPVGGPERPISGFKKGGKVKHTGLAKVHKGEQVLTKKQQSHDLTASARKRMK